MKNVVRYICAVLMVLGVSVNVWGTTTSSPVIFPAGTTSSYTTGDWGKHGAYIGTYPTSAATEKVIISDGNGYNMTFYQAYDNGDSKGMQLKKNSSAYVQTTIASSNGITVEITYSCSDDFTIELTGASNVTASSASTTATINTNSTNATLKINGTTSVVYIKYIKITPKNSGTITIHDNTCTLGPNVVYTPSSLSETVTPAEAEAGGDFTSVKVSGSNMVGIDSYVYYEFQDASSPSGTWNDDWIFTVSAESSSYGYTYIDETSYSDNLTISYTFLSTPSPGTYSADLLAWSWTDDYEDYIEHKILTVTLTVEAPCTSRSITMSDFSKDFGAADFVPTHTVSAGSGTKTWTSGTTSVATIVDGKVHIVSAGTSTITLSVAADGTNCAVEKSCTMTVNAIAPTVSKSELAVSGITSTSATLTGGKATATGGAAITQYGYIWGSSADVTWATKINAAGWNSAPTLNSEWGSKVLPLNTLSPNTTYYVRPFAYNGTVRGYGDAISFTTLQRYAVTYKINDGSATADQVEYKDHGVSYTISSDKFSRSGYTLVGWNTNNDGSGTGYDKGATYTGNAALTLYAVWGGTISFDANSGSGSMTPQVVASGGTYDLPSCTFTAPSGKTFKCWAQGSAEGTERAVGYEHTVGGNITFYAKWRDWTYTDYKFSCAELTLTPKLVTASTPIFITSVASKTVRSQDSILIVGSGLTPSQALEFPDLPSKFSIKSRANGALSVKSDGTIDTVAYIFYTPGSGDTSDGLDKLTGIKVKVGGAKPITKSLTQDIIGRHLPADFVIAARSTDDNKWYALPANMSELSTPSPVEITVDNYDNPSIAYTASTNIYNLYGQNSGAGYLEEAGWYVKLGQKNNSNYPLFASDSKSTIKGDATATVTNNIGSDYWWLLKQTNTSITNAQDAKYSISNPTNSNPLKLWLAAGGAGNPKWGLYVSGISELRLIPASSVGPTEAYFVEWAQYGGVVEVDADGVGAKKVQAVLNGTESAIKSLIQTCTSVKNRTSIYNYTLNFNDVGHVIDFDASTSNGAMLTLRWLDNSENLVAVSNITVPKIIASSRTMSSVESADKPWLQMEVHVLPGVTLTANAGDFFSNDVTIKHLEIYPNATVVVTKGDAVSGALTATTLVLRNGWSRAGTKTYDVARLYVTPSTATLKATNVYADWYIDYDQYYPIAVPWNATVANFDYRYCTVSPTVGPEANIRLRYYDGNSRATNVQEGVGSGANWKAYGEGSNLAVPSALLPSHGYIMTAKRPSGKAFSIIRMPLTLPSGTWADGAWTTSGESGSVSTTHKDEIAVTAHNSGSTPGYAQGWNLIANPYMALHQGALTYNDGSDDEIEYANVPDINFTEYDQLPIATTKLKPSSAFLVQAPKDGTVTFGTANRKASAPSSYRNEVPKASKQKAYILLNGNEAEDQMGIIIGEQYTAAYELNADLEKLLSDGTSLRTYMRYGDRNMAYVAINAELAKELIPVTVRIPANGEYIFSLHEASTASELEGIYLTDYLTGTTTNLLYDSYMFTAEAGTNAERFAINAIVGERKTPTGVDIPGVDKNGTEPVKFIWHDKVFILHNNVIYDSTGKRVNVINK